MALLRIEKVANSRCSILFAAFFVFSHAGLTQSQRSFRLPSGITPNDYASDVIVLKIREQTDNTHARVLSEKGMVLEKIQKIAASKKVQAVFPEALSPSNPLARQAPVKHTLANIYKAYLAPGSNLVQTINQLLQVEEVVYAEPYYLMKPLSAYAENQNGYIPNDPQAVPGSGKQDYLTTVRAYEAWQIEKGNPQVIIGILDTGVGLGHQDLMGNLHYNTSDPLNGLDDDGDGYIDNYLGWDIADHDNDPTADKDTHGTLVTGVAAATTDNAKGIAGAGFKSSYMPVKVFRSADNAFWQGYEAIVYAADQGCKVINLSWGAPNAFSSYGQDIINYAVLEKDVVVVAAAGNSGKQENYYPASFDHVLSVAMSDAQDNKVAQATYNYLVDLLAPGASNYTTSNGDNYQNGSGSSFAAPLVAGAAALVRARYPELNALQVMEKIRLSADNVYATGSNNNYTEQLGSGRLNMKKALQDLKSPALRMSSFTYRNHVGAYAFGGDTLQIRINLANYFKPTSANATVTLSSPSAYVTIIDSAFQMGVVDSLGTVTNTATPFLVYLHEDMPSNEKLVFRLGFEDGNYTDYQYFFINSSPDHLVINNGMMQLPVGNNGDMAFDPRELMGGSGMMYQHASVATHMGLVIATDEDSVSDNLITDFGMGSRSEDFRSLEKIRPSASELMDVEVHAVFSDEDAVHPLGLRIEQTWLADTSAGNEHFFITQYRAVHVTGNTLTGLKLGIFADWDLGNAMANKAEWDAANRLGYVYNGEQYTGVALLTSQPVAYHALDLTDGNGNTAEVGNTFTDSLRFQFLSGTANKAQAGLQGDGNDVAFMIGGESDSLFQYQTSTYAFAMVAGNSLGEVQEAVQAAQAKYALYLNRPSLWQTIFICRDSTITVTPQEGHLFRFYGDPLGTNLLYEGETFTTWPVTTDTSVFITNIDNGYESSMSRIDIRVLEPLAAFSFNESTNRGLRNDTLFLDESGNYTIDLSDQSKDVVAWDWDFDNGFQSTSRNPKTRYDQPGTYTITLHAYSKPGCMNTCTRTLTVVRRALMPDIKDQWICAGSSVTLQASNTSILRFYADASANILLHQGADFTVGPLGTDTVFYAVNANGTYESIAKVVAVKVIEPPLEITYVLDTIDLAPKYEIDVKAVGVLDDVQSMKWYIDDQLVGAGDSIQYDFAAQHNAGQAFTIRLDYAVAKEGLVCNFTTTKLLVPADSARPVFAVNYICQNESAVVSPLEGEIFYFYKDASLDSLIHKGRAMVVNEVQGVHTFYVTRMDGLKESEAVAVTVSINRFADFTLSSDTLYLSENNEVTLEAYTLDHSNPAQVSWNWDMGNGQLITKPVRFSQQFDTAGVYTIRLVAHTADGCTNTIERTLVVQNVAATRSDLIDAALTVYPNPSSGKVTIACPHWLFEKFTLHLRSLQGQSLFGRDYVYPNAPVSIDLNEACRNTIPEGLYLLQIENRYGSFFRKIIFSPSIR